MSARSWIHCTNALIVFESLIVFVPSIVISTGWQDPIIVLFAIAAMCVLIKMNVPADQAVDPLG